MRVSFSKFKGKHLKTALPNIAPKTAPVSFTFLDDQDDICTVTGTDAAGNTVDISSVATISVSTDTPAVCTADTIAGMQFTIHGLAPGVANITCIATWNDGSVGPFNFTLPVTVSGTAATGIVITPGTPTVR